MEKRTKYVVLLRVSTRKQEVTGLGLASQETSVLNYVNSVNGEIIEKFVEIESAGNKDRISIDNNLNIEKLLRKRPMLLQAINLAKVENAIIAVKEASRLSRFSLLIDFLLSSGVNFVCTDSPNDSPLIVKLKTSINEEELVKISARTKAALKAKREQGCKLTGNPQNFTNEGRKKGVEAIMNFTKQDSNHKVMGYIEICRDNCKMKFQEICDKLNTENHRTTKGKKFVVGTVIRLYYKAKEIENSGKVNTYAKEKHKDSTPIISEGNFE